MKWRSTTRHFLRVVISCVAPFTYHTKNRFGSNLNRIRTEANSYGFPDKFFFPEPQMNPGKSVVLFISIAVFHIYCLSNHGLTWILKSLCPIFIQFNPVNNINSLLLVNNWNKFNCMCNTDFVVQWWLMVRWGRIEWLTGKWPCSPRMNDSNKTTKSKDTISFHNKFD